MVLHICVRVHENISNGFILQSGYMYIVEMAMFNVQRTITQKVDKSELQFMCSARRLMVLYIVRSFVKVLRTVSELWSGHEYMVAMAMFNVQKAKSPKVDIPELRFMSSARRLMVLYICVKSRENASNGINATVTLCTNKSEDTQEMPQSHIAQFSRCTKGKRD